MKKKNKVPNYIYLLSEAYVPWGICPWWNLKFWISAPVKKALCPLCLPAKGTDSVYILSSKKNIFSVTTLQFCLECTTNGRDFWRMYKNVQGLNGPECTKKCTTITKMYKNIQNVQKCEDWSRVYHLNITTIS